MSKRDHRGLKMRNKLLLLPEDLSGGPDATASFGVSLERLAALHRKGVAFCENAIRRYEREHNATAYDLTYFDGFKVKDGQTYLHIRVTFLVRPALKLVGI